MSWDEAFSRRYDEWSSDMTADIPFYVQLARQAEGTLVELAVGNGRVATPAAQATDRKVIGLDTSHAMLEQAHERAAAAGVELDLREADMRDLTLDEEAARATAASTSRSGRRRRSSVARRVLAFSLTTLLLAFAANAAQAPPTRNVVHLEWAPGPQLALDAATPTWTDARRLLVLRGSGFTMFGPEVIDGIEWSPRGDLIAIGSFGLYVVRPDGTGLRRLARNTAGLGAWSPDGSRILFASGDGYLWVIGRDGRGAHRIALINDDFDAHAVWSRDGRRVAFQACRPRRDPDVCDNQVLDLFVVGVDGKGLRRITHRSLGDQCRLSWAPAQDIVYGNDARATVIATPAGTVRRTIRGFTCATWSPDGTRLLGWARGVPAIARADGGSPKAVVHYHDRARIGAPPADPVWSPDGTQIAFDRVYYRDDSPLSRDYIADLRTGRVRKLP